MRDRINPLVEKINLSDIVSTPTEIRTQATEQIQSAVESAFDFNSKNTDFNIPEVEEVEINQKPDVEVVENYDAEANARALVHTLESIDRIVLTGIGMGVNVKRAGGRANLQKMKVSITKEVAGEELTPTDKKLIFKLKEYEHRMKLLNDALAPDPVQTENMIKIAEGYCQETHFKVGSGTAFWMSYAGSFVGKITKVLF